SIHNFCITDMSNFYLDIIKDRLYCTGEKSVDRRAAQTAMYTILSAVSRLLAPILCFTAEEIWKYIPHTAEDDQRSIFMNQMPEKVDVSVDESFTEKWDTIYKLRSDVTKALEVKRRDKFIGAPLEAKIIIHAGDHCDKFTGYGDTLKEVFIVSAVEVSADGKGEFGSESFEGVTYDVEKASGGKCERCWSYSETVGDCAEHPTLCERCAKEIK
ncbi:MAG: class I tRNA ligase family protein, partial [Oscillospiraceae bacterium]|nr:class I tRNA ligase family protein [Oscillospiraceae bacterium]